MFVDVVRVLPMGKAAGYLGPISTVQWPYKTGFNVCLDYMYTVWTSQTCTFNLHYPKDLYGMRRTYQGPHSLVPNMNGRTLSRNTATIELGGIMGRLCTVLIERRYMMNTDIRYFLFFFYIWTTLNWNRARVYIEGNRPAHCFSMHTHNS